jgi:hypothetical protein
MVTLSPDQFAVQFAGFTESAFRLEMLDHYVATNETGPFETFLAGDEPSQEWREPWKQFVRGKVAAGASMARVHVVTEPLTDYARFEVTCVYPANVDAGEDVRILPRHRAGALDLPARDFWLLDSALAGLMKYDAAGNWLSVDLTDAPEVIDECRSARELAMVNAVPLTTYLIENEHTLKETGHGRPHRRAS